MNPHNSKKKTKGSFYKSSRFSKFNNPSSTFMPWKWMSSREIGSPVHIGETDSLNKSFYSSVRSVNYWQPNLNTDQAHHGGIFNFDFSPDGSMLVAACERHSFLVFDPFNGKLTDHKNNAHDDCVNCIRFLDSRIFATCSDDATVALWDVRNLSRHIVALEGHSNWVKNIEYESNLGLLLTSGFDGSIYTWDINNYSSEEPSFKKVFYSNSLMRSKLTPDYSKLIITTAGGFMVVIHDLDLTTLADDMGGFEPNFYRMLQLNTSAGALGVMYNRVFERKRNRIEMISDFPSENQAQVIASLQIHPQGWCVASRNTSADDNSEWTCIHNIQTLSPEEQSEDVETEASNVNSINDSSACISNPTDDPSGTQDQYLSNLNVLSRNLLSSGIRRFGQVLSDTSMDDDFDRFPSFDFPFEDRIQFYHGSIRADNSSDTPEETDELSGESPVGDSSTPHTGSEDHDVRRNHMPHFESFILPRFRLRNSSQRRQRPKNDLFSNKIYQNRPRLLNYIEEPNVGRGFIKELCFSTDGRIMCSPFGNGVRLLAFDDLCQELCDCIPTKPVKLHELCSNISHGNVVVTTKFSPTQFMFVSGCLSGKVVFHQPVL